MTLVKRMVSKVGNVTKKNPNTNVLLQDHVQRSLNKKEKKRNKNKKDKQELERYKESLKSTCEENRREKQRNNQHSKEVIGKFPQVRKMHHEMSGTEV